MLRDMIDTLKREAGTTIYALRAEITKLQQARAAEQQAGSNGGYATPPASEPPR